MIVNLLSLILLLFTGIYLIYQSFVANSNSGLINFLIIGVGLFYLAGVYCHIKEIKKHKE